ncbi:MAG: DUF3604 domain-containing protein [Paracoccaceae bacterium]|nr:DUF3604 domain-containing protein [Paracoccaceae bacterium]
MPWLEVDSGVVRHAIPTDRLGTATLSPEGRFEAGSWASFTLTYTAGVFGIDDSGSLRICFRVASDQSGLQFDDPGGAGFCTVRASNGAVLKCRWDPKGNVRPWDKSLWIQVVRGYLKEGDTITARFGVTDHGGPGIRLQTFCENSFEFRVLVDPIATFNFQPLPVQPVISIVPGRPDRYVVVIPTCRRIGERFALKVKGEDRWGNPSDQCDIVLKVESDTLISGLPETVHLAPGQFSAEFDGLAVREPGSASIRLCTLDGVAVANSNPIVVHETERVHYWGDLHGQSEETIGTGTADQYFAFARDRAFLDACAHQGNDFQITDAFWGKLNALTARYDEPGRFVTLPGYEWSGNTALGGDRNVYFPAEDRIIRRSSHALVDGGDVDGTDALTCNSLFNALADNDEWDVVMYAHCGGRYSDISVAHDGRFEKSVEIHSAWGTFEWLLHDAFRLNHRVGIVANSDGHKGRPGSSYPGAGLFGAIGGLTCFLLEQLDREALLDGMRKRRHFGTTGGPTGRMFIDLQGRFAEPGQLYHDDPAVFRGAESRMASEALMGDIVHLPSGDMTLDVALETASPIERVDLFNGLDRIDTVRPYRESDLGDRIRVLWEGAEYRGRSREVIWDGSAEVIGNAVVDVAPVNFLNRDKTLELQDNRIVWSAKTTGNSGGFDVTLRDREFGELRFASQPVTFEQPVSMIGLEDSIHDRSGELPRFVKVFRLPNHNPHKSLTFTRRIELNPDGDNPIYVRVTLEDGTRAWTSPVYVYR